MTVVSFQDLRLININSPVHWAAVADFCSEFPAIAEVGIDVSVPNETELLSTAQKTTDFVWAVRLAKISKGLIDRQWSHETFSSGATFGLDDQAEKGQRIVDVLRGEGLEEVERFNIKVDADIFVLGTDSGEMSSIP